MRWAFGHGGRPTRQHTSTLALNGLTWLLVTCWTGQWLSGKINGLSRLAALEPTAAPDTGAAKPPMKIFYCDHFVLPLPEKHRFPMQKYSLLRERVTAQQVVPPGHMQEPDPATDAQLSLAHSVDYIERVKSGSLSAQEIRRMGFPWSPKLVERSRRSVGGTIGACRTALREGIGINLAGGTQHAGPDHGEGFCVFNDSAVAARTMQVEGRIERAIIIDCDVHQGNGTAAILAGDPSIFTFSIHGEKNFPFRKFPGDLDIGLPDNTGDLAYLDALLGGLHQALDSTQVDLAIYLAGADPFAGDRLGRLPLSKVGLLERDRLVLEQCRLAGVPVAIVMAGGYAEPPTETVDIHFQTVCLAAQF
jgi:acetoin utilization deacetylase AcuC-like enzyme